MGLVAFPRFFTRAEFACKCGCGFNTIDYTLLQVLKEVRDHFGLPLVITSGCRCFDHNRSVGGSDNSQHLLGRASDFKIVGISPEDILDYINSRWPNEFGVGIYHSWIHIDSRDAVARWDER
jgi:uncharacterized protein YcbK (DUF882 family)